MEIAEIYRKRWDVELYIKFLKQNFDFAAHLITLDTTGIINIMWTTLIAAIVIRLIMHFNKMGARDVSRVLSNGYVTWPQALSTVPLAKRGIRLPKYVERDIGDNLHLEPAKLIGS